MATHSSAPTELESKVVRAAPLLAWRILLSVFAYGCASIVLRNVVRAIQGGPVEPVEIILCVPLFAFAAWLLPQTVTVDQEAIEQRRFFGFMRTRIPLTEVAFYWETNRLALNEFLGKSVRATTTREAKIDARQQVVLLQARTGNTRIVLNHYHLGRDRIVEALRNRGVPTREEFNSRI